MPKMPGQSMLKALKRLQALDGLLATQGVRIGEFAKKWEVTEKTVSRDLKVLAEMGYRATCLPHMEKWEREWFYPKRGAGLFSRSTVPARPVTPRTPNPKTVTGQKKVVG